MVRNNLFVTINNHVMDVIEVVVERSRNIDIVVLLFGYVVDYINISIDIIENDDSFHIVIF